MIRDEKERVSAEITWRGPFRNDETNLLHAQAFGTNLYDATEWNWQTQLGRYSLGWATARLEADLVGFVNVPWDGSVHAWIQDVMVAADHHRAGVGVALVQAAAAGARAAGCEWLHVDFEDHLEAFYFDACGFTPTTAGLQRL